LLAGNGENHALTIVDLEVFDLGGLGLESGRRNDANRARRSMHGALDDFRIGANHQHDRGGGAGCDRTRDEVPAMLVEPAHDCGP
jgi:hypothetical protein